MSQYTDLGLPIPVSAPQNILIPPQGRLTLTSNTPVMTADSTAQTSIYYAPYVGNIVPVYDGANMAPNSFSQLTLSLNSTYHPASKVFDVYASLQSGSLVLSAMYWGGNTSRSSSAGGYSGTGNATITQKNGIWVNAAAISASDSFNGSTGYAIPQYQGTYLGSFYTTAAGETGMQFKPAPTAGGANNILGVYNAYNQVNTMSMNREGTLSWTYATAAWRAMDGSSSNSISWVDGLQQSSIAVQLNTCCTSSSTPHSFNIGINLNSTSNTPDVICEYKDDTAATIQNLYIGDIFTPQLGFNYVQAMENSPDAVTFTVYGGNAVGNRQLLSAILEM